MTGETHPATHPPSPPPLPRTWLWRVWGAIGFLWLLAVVGFALERHALVFEAPLYVTLLALVLSRGEVQRVLLSIGRVRIAFVAVLFGLLIPAHLLNMPRLTYPLARWTMYSNPQPSALQFKRLVAVDPDGRERILLPFDLASIAYASSLYGTFRRRPIDSPKSHEGLRILAGFLDEPAPDGHLEWRLYEIDGTATPLRDHLTLIAVERIEARERDHAP